MRNLLLVLTILLSLNSFAKALAPTYTPDPSWKTLGYSKSSNHACANNLEAMKSEFHSNYRGYAQRFTYLINDPSVNALETQCSEIIYVNYFEIEDLRYKRTFTYTTIYCKPRSFSELALMSLYKSCVAEPKEECFKSDILGKLNEIQLTKYINENLNKCKEAK